MELFWLEKPSETIKSNCVPSTVKATTNSCTQVPNLHIC